MNTNDDLVKVIGTVLKDGGYNRNIVWGQQKPKSLTYLMIVHENKNRVSITTGGAVYEHSILFRFYTNTTKYFELDEIDKVTNILDSNPHYRDTTQTYWFNSSVTGYEQIEDEDYKIQINATFSVEEVE